MRARISLVVGLAATTLNVLVATLIGGTSGFLGGKLDLAVQRFVDARMAFPGLLLLLTIMSVAGQGLPQIIVVLGVADGVGGSTPRRTKSSERRARSIKTGWRLWTDSNKLFGQITESRKKEPGRKLWTR